MEGEGEHTAHPPSHSSLSHKMSFAAFYQASTAWWASHTRSPTFIYQLDGDYDGADGEQGVTHPRDVTALAHCIRQLQLGDNEKCEILLGHAYIRKSCIWKQQKDSYTSHSLQSYSHYMDGLGPHTVDLAIGCALTDLAGNNVDDKLLKRQLDTEISIGGPNIVNEHLEAVEGVWDLDVVDEGDSDFLDLSWLKMASYIIIRRTTGGRSA